MTIPTAINIPYTDLEYDEDLAEFYYAALEKLGIKKIKKGFDLSKAKTIMMFCNGSWCGQSPKAIKELLRLDILLRRLCGIEVVYKTGKR